MRKRWTMRGHSRTITAFSVLLLLIVGTMVQAYWETDGTPVCTASWSQEMVKIAAVSLQDQEEGYAETPFAPVPRNPVTDYPALETLFAFSNR